MGHAYREPSAPVKHPPRSSTGTGGRVLGILVAFAAGLLAWNAYTGSRLARIATGPPSPTQEALFESLATRPDTLVFFHGLTPSNRLAMARNLGAYRNARLVPLVTTLLETHDEAARIQLARALQSLAKFDSVAVSRELRRHAGPQRDAVFQALRACGERTIPIVVARLGEPENREGAARLLVEWGPPCERYVLELLGSREKGARIAAADILGKLRSVGAVSRLLKLWPGASEQERAALLGAIANIGDRRAEPLLRKLVTDAHASTATREKAAIGLGRIASREAVAILERLAVGDDPALAMAAREGLLLSGDTALRWVRSTSLRITLAAALRSQMADRVLTLALTERIVPREELELALRSCEGRPRVALSVARRLRALDPASDGDLIAAGIQALSRTPEAKAVLDALSSEPAYVGWIARAGGLSALEKR